MYNIQINTEKKVLYAFAEGFLNLEDANGFIKDFKEKSSSINSKDYSLLINTKNLKPATPEIADKMGGLILMYINTPFKARYALKLDSAVGQMQVNRVGKTIPGFDTIKFVDTEGEAYLLIG